MTRGPAGRQGHPFPTFAISHRNRDGSAVHCLAQSEIHVIQILFVTCGVYVVVLVHRQLRCAAECKKQQIINTYFCFFAVAK